MGKEAVGDHFDVLVVGGGAAGCVVAARLSEDPARSVCLLEAGPDYGHRAAGRWPADLLDADEFPSSHDWGIEGGQPSVRARVIGGCTAHNACYVSVGAPSDYDEWEQLGNPGWSWATMRPLLARAESMLSICRPDIGDAHPWKRAVVAACASTGIEVLDDFNDPQRPRGIGSVPRNAPGGVRWNAAFAYLDSARGRPNLEIRGGALVDRIELRAQAAEAVVVRSANAPVRLTADLIVLAAGTYGSPALLLRSGIGDEESSRALSIQLRHELPGVGQELSDHGGVAMSFGRSDRFLRETQGWSAGIHAPQPIVVLKAGSAACPSDSWNLHITPVASSTDFWTREPAERGRAMISVLLMKPASRGAVRLRTT
ncbi:MAG: GMC family oxidoreductase, partial [Solirubrobacterales bacterium]